MGKENLQKAKKRMRNALRKLITITTIFSTLMIVCAMLLSLGTINAELAMLIIVLLFTAGSFIMNIYDKQLDQLLKSHSSM